MSNWQPIETAPKGSGLDGPDRIDDPAYIKPPKLLLWTKQGHEIGHYDWYYHPGYGWGAHVTQSPWRGAGYGIYPTHWMPLPNPPEESA